jgi:hypothetical protein
MIMDKLKNKYPMIVLFFFFFFFFLFKRIHLYSIFGSNKWHLETAWPTDLRLWVRPWPDPYFKNKSQEISEHPGGPVRHCLPECGDTDGWCVRTIVGRADSRRRVHWSTGTIKCVSRVMIMKKMCKMRIDNIVMFA